MPARRELRGFFFAVAGVFDERSREKRLAPTMIANKIFLITMGVSMRFSINRMRARGRRLHAMFVAAVVGLFVIAATAGTNPAQATILTFQFSGPIGQGEWQLPKRPAFPTPFVEFANYLTDCCFWRPDLVGTFEDAGGVFGNVTVGYQPVFYVAEQLGGFQTLISYVSPGGLVQWNISLLGPQLFSGPLTDPIFEEGEYTLVSDEDTPQTYFLRIFDPDATPVNEPATLGVMGAGLAALALARRPRHTVARG
jgi:hypothetical protein